MTLESLTDIGKKEIQSCGLLNHFLLLFDLILYIQNFPLLAGKIVSYPLGSPQALKPEIEHVISVKDGRHEPGGAGQKSEAR